MKCGALQLWPQPTIKTTLGSTSLNFKLDDVHLKLGSSFDAVNNLIKDAFVIFRREIKVLENRNSNSNYDTSSNSNSNLRDKEQRTRYEAVNENSERDEVHETTVYEMKSRARHDISQVLVYVHVKKSSDIHLTLQTDESYNLTLNREYLFLTNHHQIDLILSNSLPQTSKIQTKNPPSTSKSMPTPFSAPATVWPPCNS
jgi:beta-hexosaminidase Fdl